MKNVMRDFDKIIRKKLNSDNISKDVGNWEAFKKKFCEYMSPKDAEFDRIISKKLNSSFHSTKNQDWRAFSVSYADIIKTRNKIITIKVAEFLSTLFIFILLGWFPKNSEINYIPADNKSVPIFAMADSRQQTNEPIYDISIDETPQTDNDHQYLTDIFRWFVNPLLYILPQDDMDISTATCSLSEEESCDDKNIYNGSLGLLQTVELGPVTPLDKQIIAAPNTINFKNNEHISLEWSIIPAALMNFNIVASPYDPIYKLNGYTRISSQPGLALMVSAKKGSTEILCGLRLKRTEYQPKQVKEIFGGIQSSISSVSLKNVSYDVMEVPFILRKHLINNADFKMFAGIYAGLNVISKSDYTVEYDSSVPLRPQPPFVTDGKANHPKLEQKPFSTGWLEGGSFSANSFFTGGIEVGIEKSLQRDLSLNLAASFGKYLSSTGKGPNRDSFDDVNLSIGFRKLL